LTAKQLLADTNLPVTQVALISGHASVRRFNAAFLAHYGLSPSQLRRAGTERSSGGLAVRLGLRPPYDDRAMLGFFAQRAIRGIERVDVDTGALVRTLAVPTRQGVQRGWLAATFDMAHHQVLLRVGDSLLEVLPVVIRRVRDALDLDADPRSINKVLHDSFPGGDGLRVPGALSGYEVAVRAVLGQQITVAAARTLAQRLVDRFGESVETPWPDLNRLFPEPAVLARAEGDALGQLGIVRQRQAAIVAIAQAVVSGRLQLHAGADVSATIEALTQLPGIGDWTAQYIAMRALRWPDAFPAGDVALHKALGVQGEPRPARAAAQASQAWRPWRSYAVIRAWHGLAATPAAATATAPPANKIDTAARPRRALPTAREAS
jgi:AraC family transcriptional regulator of adaptative response / DNA-3-methyladenine glycosylase II